MRNLASCGILQVFYGPSAFRKIVLEPGNVRCVGRGHRADVVLAQDKGLAGRHFEVAWNGRAARVRDLGSPSGIALGGQPARSGELRHRGWMSAGGSTFRFFVEGFTPAPEPVAASPQQDGVLAELAAPCERGELYAVLDAARAERILQLAEEAVDDHASLYEGAPGRALDDVAPYLVHFLPGSGLLGRLVREGWGRAWGIYLASAASPKLVRRHLRRFLIVEAEPQRERLYFRFYDPRVLCRFAALCTVRQKSELVAGLDAVWFEDESGKLCRLIREGATDSGRMNVSHP
ncbi:MAG: DUF4123 domain-containing protein [Deltaproteobacteria bacterium]|nr:DUF4123 domain-containing protein [Deltaproteobacteria bacterium]